MTDDNGVVKHYVGGALITDSDQTVLKHVAGTVKIDSSATSSDSATIAQIYDMIGAQNGFKYVRVTITSSDDRVKLFKDSAPTVTSGGYTGAASIAWEVQIDTLGETTAVLDEQNYYWAYAGDRDGGNPDSSVAQITLTATVSFSQTALS